MASGIFVYSTGNYMTTEISCPQKHLSSSWKTLDSSTFESRVAVRLWNKTCARFSPMRANGSEPLSSWLSPMMITRQGSKKSSVTSAGLVTKKKSSKNDHHCTWFSCGTSKSRGLLIPGICDPTVAGSSPARVTRPRRLRRGFSFGVTIR
jgi:hypothetical protein